jgi:hypothetical protein
MPGEARATELPRRSASALKPRIMILWAAIDNPLQYNDLGKPAEGRCTYRCIRVEVSAQLAEFVAAWPSLTDGQRQRLSLIYTAATDERQPPLRASLVNQGDSSVD